MTRPQVGLDLDGFVYQFDKTAQYMIARRMGYERREELAWDHNEYWRGVPGEQWDWLWLPENSDRLYRHGHLYRGAIEFVAELDEIADITAVTTRPEYTAGVTREWLSFHFPSVYIPLRIMQDKGKARVDFLLDDWDKNTDAIRKAGGKGILLDRPWNQRETRYDWRAFSYDDVIRILREEIANAAEGS